MESLYHQTNKLLLETQSCFQQLERANGESAVTIEREIQARIDQVISNCERLDILVSKEPTTRRQNAKLRVDQLKYDNQHLQAALRNLQHQRYLKEREEIEREELLSRSFSANRQSEGDTSIFIDHSLQHHSSLQNANRGLDDLIGSGSNILTGLRDQRETLKGAHRRIMDLANTLGMSNTVMRLIERRAYEDKFVLFGGMLVTGLVILLVVIYCT